MTKGALHSGRDVNCANSVIMQMDPAPIEAATGEGATDGLAGEVALLRTMGRRGGHAGDNVSHAG